MPDSDPYAHLATNPRSKFSDFSITLDNGATLEGIAFIPPLPFPRPSARPPLIGIHGATCSAHSWDVSPTCTASLPASLTGTPFVAFHRPNFLRSSGWLVDNALPPPPSSPPRPSLSAGPGRSFFEEEAHWYYPYILPALWRSFGAPNACSSLVTTSHSMSVPITIIAAGMYCSQPSDGRAYPWAGIVVTGFSEVLTETLKDTVAGFATSVYAPEDLPYGHDPRLHLGPYRKEDKISPMLGPEGCCDGAMREPCARQTTPYFAEEAGDMVGVWEERKGEWLGVVRMPVLHALGELDWVWRSERADVEAFGRGFVNAPRVEGALIKGAPHAIEWSRTGNGWWLRVMGWAEEVAMGEEVGKLGLKTYV